MLRKNIFDNPIIIFLLFVGVSLVNIIFSVHFVSIIFAGVVFIAFTKTLKNKYYYSLFLVILTFLIIENVQGFRPFSLVALSLFIYIFLKPYLQQIFTSSELVRNLYVIIFYLGMVLIYSFFNNFDIIILPIIVINILIDIIILGMLA